MPRQARPLYRDHADAPRYPASLTKMMTLYLIFDALESGRISKGTAIPVSANAANEAPSKLGLKQGQTITVEQVILALVTKSANDAATAIGEFLGGSEVGFARLMTQKARQLGMTSTTFRNANGLPDTAQKTTARDMARLGLALRDHHPGYYSYFNTRSFKYKGRRFGNHNHLLGRVKGVDGIKTGYTNASGFNLVSSVEAQGRSIVAVVMGGHTVRSRDARMKRLISRCLAKASNGPDRFRIDRGGESALVASAASNASVPTPTWKPARVADSRAAFAAEAMGDVSREQALSADAIDPISTASTQEVNGSSRLDRCQARPQLVKSFHWRLAKRQNCFRTLLLLPRPSKKMAMCTTAPDMPASITSRKRGALAGDWRSKKSIATRSLGRWDRTPMRTLQLASPDVVSPGPRGNIERCPRALFNPSHGASL